MAFGEFWNEGPSEPDLRPVVEYDKTLAVTEGLVGGVYLALGTAAIVAGIGDAIGVVSLAGGAAFTADAVHRIRAGSRTPRPAESYVEGDDIQLAREGFQAANRAYSNALAGGDEVSIHDFAQQRELCWENLISLLDNRGKVC